MRAILFILTGAALCAAQTPPKPAPDVLILNDGEKLLGHFVRSNGGSVVFTSDLLGDLTIDWSKIKSLQSAGRYAVISKNVKRGGRKDAEVSVPQGTINEADQKIEIASQAGPKTIPLSEAEHVVDLAAFEKAFGHEPGILEGWHGTITAGASLVEATQQSRTFTESVALVRGIPTVDWLARRNKTSVDFSSSYGVITQPNTPRIKTSIYHGDAERDEYFSASAYGFGEAEFDHNFSQGLDLQQTYVGGIGWSAIKKANEGLDLKAGVSFIRQQFAGKTTAMNLASSLLDEKYVRKFWKGATFTQELSVSPTFNNTRAISAQGNATLAIPVYKRFTFTTGVIDSFLNDPPAGFKRNSFQFITGLTYVLP